MPSPFSPYSTNYNETSSVARMDPRDPDRVVEMPAEAAAMVAKMGTKSFWRDSHNKYKERHAKV